jgi:mono/diheme cytochrome c family protein
MIARGMLLVMIVCVFFLMALGCGSPRPQPIVEGSYPVRSDWLLVGQVPGDPSRGMEPGYPPYLRLDAIKALKTEPTDADDRVLKQGNFLNARNAELDVREELAKVLNRWFGTPARPIVLPVDDELKGALEMLEKLPKMREELSGKQAELAELQKAAKPPEEIQSLREEIQKLTADIQTREANVAKKIEDLQTASADLRLDEATLAKGGAVYRNYCQQCHGLTGDGNGPSAKQLLPMPRDYRQGLFKYLTSHPKLETKRKPLRSDLRRTIVKGLDGSPMPQFAALKDDEIEAVISYVIHLSIRGEAEYEAMRVALDEKGDGLAPKEVGPKVIKDAVDATLLWLQSSRTPISSDADPNPYLDEETRQESAARGYRLFTSAEIGCAKCHTNFGRSAPFKYDAWGTIIRPRNLTVATLRGGREPDAIYARIFGGILGTGMPTHKELRPTEDEKSKGTDKIWDLVHFVMYASESEKRQLLKEKFQIEIDD